MNKTHSSASPSSASCAGYQWLLESNSRHWYCYGSSASYISRTWTNHTILSNMLFYIQTACYSLTMKRAHLLLNKIHTSCCPDSTVVEQAWYRDSRNLSIQTAPWPPDSHLTRSDKNHSAHIVFVQISCCWYTFSFFNQISQVKMFSTKWLRRPLKG